MTDKANCAIVLTLEQVAFLCGTPGETGWNDVISPLSPAGVRALQTLWRQLHNAHLASKGLKAGPGG